MINLTAMNLFRLFKNKVLYVTVVLIFAIFAFLTSMETDPEQQELDRQIMEDQGIDPDSDTQEGMVIGGSIDTQSSMEDIYAGMVGCGLVLTMVGIFATIYADEERKCGFLKNLTVGSRDKKYIFISKIPVMLLYSAIILAVSFLAVYVGCMTHAQMGYEVGSYVNLIRYFLTEVLLHTAFGTLILAFYEIVRNSVLSTVLSIFASLNLFGFVFGMMESRIAAIGTVGMRFVERFGLTQYFLVTRARMMTPAFAEFPYVSSAVVAVVGLTLYLVIGMLIFSKRDTY